MADHPTRLHRYEVSFYAKMPDERLIYVVFYEYVADIERNPSGGFWVYEYRTATASDPSPLVDTGTATYALIFHPRETLIKCSLSTASTDRVEPA